MCPVRKNTDPLHTLSHRRNETLLGFIMVCGQEERKQVQTVHLFVKRRKKVGHTGVSSCSFVDQLHWLQHVSPLVSSHGLFWLFVERMGASLGNREGRLQVADARHNW